MPASRKYFRTALLAAVLGLSLAGVVGGFWQAWNYESTPGRAAQAKAAWPVNCSLARVPGKATLILALHPYCPCSRATLQELAQLMTHCSGKVTAYALFAPQPGDEQDLTQQALWKEADITGVTRLVDDHEMAVRQFGASTSGQVFLYDAASALRFSGGITDSRGHAGDNDGLSMVEAILLTGNAPADHTPVFGCALH